MISIIKLTSTDQVLAYHTDRADYYTHEFPGQWLAPDLGLRDTVVTKEQFRRVLDGNHPFTGEALATERADRIPAMDVVMAVPKSVSAAFAVAPPSLAAAVEQDVLDSARASLTFLSDQAGRTRRGHNGKEHEPVRLNSALFLHATNRNLDPHLHVHAVAMNLSRRADGTWGALDSRPLYQWAKAAGVVFQSELASRLHQRGFTIERDARDTFRLREIPEALVASWSSRHHEITQDVAGHGLVGAPSRDIAQKRTRQGKQHVPRSTLYETWKTQAQSLGLGWQPDHQFSPHKTPPVARPLMRDAILTALTEHNATFDLRTLYITIGAHTYGQHDASGLEAAVQQFREDPALIRLPGGQWTTQAMLDLETATLARLGALAERPAPLLTSATRLDPALSDEQRHAVTTLLTQPGSLCQGQSKFRINDKVKSVKTTTEIPEKRAGQFHFFDRLNSLGTRRSKSLEPRF